MNELDTLVANARAAATALSGRRVERDEVELYLERLEESRARILSAGVTDLPATAATGKLSPR